MNKLITVAVPTRHRLPKLARFVDSFLATTNSFNRPHLLVVSDSPEPSDPTIPFMDNLRRLFGYPAVEYNINTEKSGLAGLWNQCILRAPTDWVLVCNDDGIFQPGWLEWLEAQIAKQQYYQINLMHYGSFCIHKKMTLLNGWFDERFRGGGWEDNDWQLRLRESNLHRMVYEWTTDWTYMKHEKVNDGNNWTDQNNGEWICLKWGRTNGVYWKEPSFRRMPEVNWHPLYTALYEGRYRQLARYVEINADINSNKPIYHWDVPVEQPKPTQLSTEAPSDENNTKTTTTDSGP